MPNQLSIPYKRSRPAPIRMALRGYIQQNHPETHPDAFDWDISQWETYRKEAVTDEVHESKIPKVLAYHTQLVFILTKLPWDTGLEFSYDAMFSFGGPVTMPNITFERVALLLNLVSLFCNLGSAEDRSSIDGIKRSVAHYSKAAGVISYILSDALPPFVKSMDQAQVKVPLDFNENFLKSLQFLLLAQAQECAWQKAMITQVKNSLLAKLASQVSNYYSESLKLIQQNPDVESNFPQAWISHIEAKVHHFAASAQFRQSLEDNTDRRYGMEVGRLRVALETVKKAITAARKSGVARVVLDDSISLLNVAQKTYADSDHSNELIYHQDVPPATSIPEILKSNVVAAVVLPGLTDPIKALGSDKSDNLIFGGLEGWGVRRACKVYQDEKDKLIQNHLAEFQHELDKGASATLSDMHLPAALEALSLPVGLPPSLLQKAEEVRQEDGPKRVAKMIEDMPRLAKRCHSIVNDSLDALDEEASEDEDYRKAYEPYDKWNRAPSSVANSDLIGEAQKYQALLEQAGNSDALVMGRWEEWRDRIGVLAEDEAVINATVPRSTFLPHQAVTTSRSDTQLKARALRKSLEDLEDLQHARRSIVSRARQFSASDDIKPRILRLASTFEQWTEIEPAVFQDTIDEQMEKYERFKDELEENAAKQDELLDRITAQNEEFLQSRKDDPAVKAREVALQSLDSAYQKYRELTKDLEDGLRFYNDLATQLARFRATVNAWVDERRASVQWLIESLQAVPNKAVEAVPPKPILVSSPQPPLSPVQRAQGASSPPIPTPKKIVKVKKPRSIAPVEPEETTIAAKVEESPLVAEASAPISPVRPTARSLGFNLPKPGASTWEATPMPPPPTPGKSKSKTRKKELA